MAQQTTPAQPRPGSSGPESLDQVIHTTKAHGWWALWAIAAAVLIALVWAFVATIPMQVSATGVVSLFGYSSNITATGPGVFTFESDLKADLTAGERIGLIHPYDGSTPLDVVAPKDGQLLSLLVSEGQGVEPGTDVARMVHPVDPAAGIAVVTYVPASQALNYREGETASVNVTDVTTSQTQVASATISDVADTPSTLRAMTNMTGSAALSRQWMAESDGAPFRILLDINDWPADSSGDLPAAGQIVEITNTYGSVHPIELLFGGN